MNVETLISDRARGIDTSGIRRIFNLGKALRNPIDLSIGQPDFPVPEPIKRAAIKAIEQNQNGYTLTQGVGPLRSRLARLLREDVGWDTDDPGVGFVVTSGTCGALLLSMLVLLGPGDEAIIPDPYFVVYPDQIRMSGATPVLCDTYPDFRMTAQRVEPLITPRTKLVLMNSPSNPAGVVNTSAECRDLLELCRSRNVLLLSDEIYDEFAYAEARTDRAVIGGRPRCPSPARCDGADRDMLLIRGFGKTYGMTGWRMGWAAGPTEVINQITKLQQYTFVCAPAPAQHGCVAALDTDISQHVNNYQKKRDMVVARLGPITDLPTPSGAFYAFPRVPDRLGLTGEQFVERCIERGVLAIPGGVFSARDTHIRISYATDPDTLARGLDVLVELMGG